MQTHERYNGIFLPANSQFAGMLNISGGDSILKIVGTSFIADPEADALDIHGILSDGKKASLIDCVLQRNTRYRLGENTQSESVYFPHYVVVGEEFISSSEPVICAVRYHFENVDRLLSGHKTFRSLLVDKDEVLQILEADHKHSEKIAKEHGWQRQPFEPELGEHPHLVYFSGLWEIVACQTEIGKISLTNRTSHGMGDATGIGIDNEVVANIEFSEPKTLNAAIHALQVLHGLFELSLGCRQRIRWIELELIHRSPETDSDMPSMVRLYWSLCNDHVKGDPKVSLNDSLLVADRRPEEFAKVTKEWMNSANVMGDPRNRFAVAFFGSYSINRIVGAANMFDLLPESHAPRTREVDPSFKEVASQSRKLFATLPDSFAKQSVLSTLGRVGKASLRDKIYHRAEIVLAVVGDHFPDLFLPCHHAVACRNHYVHGSDRKFDYQENFIEFAFVTDTLEFVFAMSELIELGWNIKRWMDGGVSMTHAFGAYRINYLRNIQRLKVLVDK